MTTKPKLSVYNVINKSFIAWGIKNDKQLRVYYKWDLEKRKTPMQIPSIVIDYDTLKREWYVNFIDINENVKSCTIDDITGSSSISSFNPKIGH